MEFLDYIQVANKATLGTEQQGVSFSVALLTNFTDSALQKVLKGVSTHQGIHSEFYQVPYKQYSFELKNKNSGLWNKAYSLVFCWLDANNFTSNEFVEHPEYFEEFISDIRTFAETSKSTIVIANFILPYESPYSHRPEKNSLLQKLLTANAKIADLSASLPNVHMLDVNGLAQNFGVRNIRDLRGLYAFDTPFSNAFITVVAEQLSSYFQALTGKSKKCIVLDLDNVLWGGVVGELGPNGIHLGPGYPGLAFQNFQQTLLEYRKQGILLAINSKNNLTDVEEVFEKNQNMILNKKHFSASRINWDNKADNMLSLAEELNLGLESFVFLDDEAVNRALIREHLPQVLVPEFSIPPEQYSRTLFSLPVFNPFETTAEDAKRGELYAEEKQRNEMRLVSGDLESFVNRLAIEIDVKVNDLSSVPRIAQLTQKTNQWNLTTRRYSEIEIQKLMQDGLVFSARVKDVFGDYGLTALAIVIPVTAEIARLDTLLLSCRILGRGIEFRFFEALIEILNKSGTKKLQAEFLPTVKNSPAAGFLDDIGFPVSQEQYRILDCEKFLTTANSKVNKNIKINSTEGILWIV